MDKNGYPQPNFILVEDFFCIRNSLDHIGAGSEQ